MGKGLNFERRRPGKVIGNAKKILKTIEKAHTKNKREPEPTSKNIQKLPAEPNSDAMKSMC